MNTIAITGANGFIGRYFCTHFRNKGWKVLALSRENPNIQGIDWLKYSLEEGISPKTVEGFECIIHLAFQPLSKQNKNAYFTNIKGCEQLIETSRKAGIKKIVYFSSTSAHSEAESQYGKHKQEAEKLFDGDDCLIIKPGLVLGEGGMIEKIGGLIKKLPAVPVVSGGEQLLQTLTIENLAYCTEQLIVQNKTGLWVVAENKATSIIEFYKTVAECLGKDTRFISVPYLPVFYAAYLAESLGIELPLTVENLKGLKKMRSFDTSSTEIALNYTFGDMKDNVSTYKTFLQKL